MSYWCDKHSQYKPCRSCQMEALRNKQEKSEVMTPTNHLDELKKLRDLTYHGADWTRTYGPACTPEQIAALDHFIKREESLADAEGHAAVLRDDAEDAQALYDAKIPMSHPCSDEKWKASLLESITARLAGALALVENPTLKAELTTAREQCEFQKKVLASEIETSTTLRQRRDMLKEERDAAREQIAGLEREQAKDAVEWADLCLVHKKEADTTRTALAEKEAELRLLQIPCPYCNGCGYVMVSDAGELCGNCDGGYIGYATPERITALEAENTRLRAECKKLESIKQIARTHVKLKGIQGYDQDSFDDLKLALKHD